MYHICDCIWVCCYLYSLCVIDQRGKDDDTKDQEEDEQHELFGGGPERLDENLEARRVTGQLEQPEDTDDGEELEDVGVLQMRGHLLEDEVDVEAHRGHVVNDIDTGTKQSQSF